MMKKALSLMLVLLLALSLPAYAEDAQLPAPYALTLPEGVSVSVNEGSLTYIRDTSRVVAIVIGRVPDPDPAAALPKMMQQFDPNAIFGAELLLSEGLHGMTAVTHDKFGEGIDLATIMVLCEGDLLILAGYDLTGDANVRDHLMADLLRGMTVNGAALLTEAEATAEPAAQE